MSTEIQKFGEWTPEQKDLLKKNVCPQGCTDAEFKLFLLQCQRTGLDPFIKQAWMMERKTKLPNGQWVSKFEFQAAESGVAAKVDMFPDYKGTQGAAVHEGDEILINEAEGTVHHAYNPLKRGKLIGAWAKTHRAGRFTKVSWLTLESRIQRKQDGSPLKQWATDPAGQIAKCARMDSYRNAYPNHFEKVYAEGELPEFDEGDGAAMPKAGVEGLKERLGVKTAEAKAPTAQAGPTVIWGAHKGKLIADLSAAQLSGLVDEVSDLIERPDNAPYVDRLKACRNDLLDEVERRQRKEPGTVVDAEFQDVELEPNTPSAQPAQGEMLAT